MTQPAQPNAAETKRTSRTPRWVPRRWWTRLLIGLVLLCVVLVLLVPVIASSSMVRSRVVAALDAKLHGSFAIESLSMSWFGPCEVRGFRVTDVEGREVLNASRARLDAGLWGLMTDWKSLGRVDVDATHVELIVGPDGTISLFEALKSVTPSDEPLPELVADFHLRGGSVTLTNAEGRTYRVEALDADVTVDRLNRIAGETTLRLAGGGALTAKAELDQLLRDGQFSVETLVIRQASVEVTEPVALGPVHAFLTGSPDLTGSVRRLKLEGDPAKGTLDVELTDLRDARFDPKKVQPVSAQVSGHYAVNRNLAADLTFQLRGKPEKIELSFIWPLREGALDFQLPDLRKAVFAGTGVALPDFKLTASGSVDLAELGKVFPQVFKQVGGDRIGGNPLR
ncbi:MAG TPA: hypothetical protein VMX57_05650, partial [Planctomycetota bacterium]|nr:hypothetical protein [Planctomycetota bacterium]